ncbi:hypothetical protein [Naasia sp. SYSU D00948]|nr:hypothetical protein [Naasia sp. SYSU D00948]
MVILLIAILAAGAAASVAAAVRLVRRDGYGPVRTRLDYDTRLPLL